MKIRGKVLHTALWWIGDLYDKEVKKGYSRATSEMMQSFRVGPICIAWEVSEES
jgi:hypothetical protein